MAYIHTHSKYEGAPEGFSLLDSVVIGYDTLNEPSGGFMGWEDITKFSPHLDLKNGIAMTPIQSMLCGEGEEIEAESWKFIWRGFILCKQIGPVYDKKVKVNPNRKRCWQTSSTLRIKNGYSGGCIWLAHGLYNLKSREATKNDYFSKIPPRPRMGVRALDAPSPVRDDFEPHHPDGEPCEWRHMFWKRKI